MNQLIEASSGRIHRLDIRVTYQETDGQRRVHHANYLNYFERGRVEMLRASGVSYLDLEESGLMLVVAEMNVRYVSAAQFDDLLTLTTKVADVRKVRIKHHYELHRGDELIVSADSTVACIGENGKPAKLPKELLETVNA
jgi:acyl-CoA thioester hydrolase